MIRVGLVGVGGTIRHKKPAQGRAAGEAKRVGRAATRKLGKGRGTVRTYIKYRPYTLLSERHVVCPPALFLEGCLGAN